MYNLINGNSKCKETVADAISQSLINDQFVDNNKVSKIELTAKYFKIDGEKQPSNIHRKYKNIYESHTGISLQKDSKVILEINPERMAKQPGTSI